MSWNSAPPTCPRAGRRIARVIFPMAGHFTLPRMRLLGVDNFSGMNVRTVLRMRTAPVSYSGVQPPIYPVSGHTARLSARRGLSTCSKTRHCFYRPCAELFMATRPGTHSLWRRPGPRTGNSVQTDRRARSEYDANKYDRERVLSPTTHG